MRRKDIRRGTGTILLVASLCTIIIFTTAYVRSLANHGDSEHKQLKGNGTPDYIWSEGLTNEMSDYEPFNSLDTRIERFIGKWGIKGLSLAVTRNDSLMYAKGYGWADMEDSVRMTPGHIMRLASASKLVTAIAIMHLSEEGKLSLDSKVFGPSAILNDTAYTNAIEDERMFDITIDHLLRHRAGFGRGAGDPMFNTKDIMAAKHLTQPPTNEQLTSIVLGRKIAFTPGEGFRYSNFGYMLLSLVIERVTGKNYWEYVTDEILKPAGCYRFRPATNYYAEKNPNEVRYYGPDSVKVEEFNGSGRMVERVYGGSNVNGLVGAGGWCASASDLARLVAAIDKYPQVANILSDASIDRMTAFDQDENMAIGWSESFSDGKWRRTGTLSSTHTLIERFPNGECWVMVTNSGVWTGFHFSRDMSQLVSDLRVTYSKILPKRDLFNRARGKD